MPPLPFDPTLDKELIRQVQKYPIIYDYNKRDKCTTESRDDVWQKISDALDRPVASCKTRWVNIRDNMGRKLRERERKPRPRTKKYNLGHKYKYENDLQFLIPFFKYCKRSGSQDSNDESNDDFLNNAEVEELYLENDDFDPMECRPDVSNIMRSVDQEDIKEAYATVAITPQEDALSTFLTAVGSTMRNFNPYFLNQAKSRIFQVVQDCELQQLNMKDQQPPTT